MQRESFIFYQSFWNATKHLPNENQKNVLVMIIQYGIDGIEPDPEIDPTAYAFFLMAKPQIDKNNQRFSNGKGGGRPPKKLENRQKPKDNQEQTEVKANVNDNVNVNDKENDNILNKFIEVWNNIQIKQKGVPKQINLKRCKGINNDILSIRKAILKKYNKEEIQEGFKKYVEEIEKRSYDAGGYWSQRFSFYEFLKQSNGLKKFINS